MTNKYLIQHKIKTLAELEVGLNNNSFPKMDIDGFLFTQWEFNYTMGWLGDAWLVEKEIEAMSAEEAIQIFRKDLDKIIPKVAFISQCYMDFYFQPFLIKKINTENKIFFLCYTEDWKGVPLHFDEDELAAFNKLKSEDNLAYVYLQECVNCFGYLPRLMLLFSSLEALCGREEKLDDAGKIYFTYNHDKMVNILGGDLYNIIFGQNGLRHKINHGDIMDSIFPKDYTEIIYKKIIIYLNRVNNIKIDEDVMSPQRHFYGNYHSANLFLEPENNFDINLKNCIDSFSQKPIKVRGCKIVTLGDVIY